MTAKEALLEFVDELSESDAREILPLVSGRFWAEGPEDAPRLSSRELLKLPPALRDLIIRRELAELTQEDRDEAAAAAEEWAAIDADALALLDD